MANREEAEQIVKGIAESKGRIDDEDWKRLQDVDPVFCAKLQKNMADRRKFLGRMIETLAHELYTTDARFVFELLQNADDNCFSRSESTGSPPFVKFELQWDRVIVDCNENGFTEKDLTSICDVGNSTKTNSHGYIGNKGIGFKSVFTAAWKVHVQSGNFSFCFEHRRGENGMGMVTPIWTDLPADESDRHGTRMTLYLHPDGDSPFNHHNRHTIVEQQLHSLDPTCLLFLKNLKQMTITIWDANGKTNSSKTFNLDEMPNRVVRLKTTLATSQGATQESFKQYRKVSRVFAGLPLKRPKLAKKELEAATTGDQSESDREAAGENLESSAEVILAYPLTEDGIPLEQRQQLFAFLPMKNSDYNFIIHTDFDTTANREDIVPLSPRNKALRTHIATTFVDAIKEFCDEDSALRYRWPAFLPITGETHDEFWEIMNDEIKQQISRSPVFVSRNKQERRAISEVVTVAGNFVDECGSPLLDNIAMDPFYSPLYLNKATQKLRVYGLRVMHISLAIRLTQIDLETSVSKIKAPETSEVWHSRISRVFNLSSGDHLSSLRLLDLIPLETGGWTRVSDGAVYFPSTKGIAVPQGLPLRTISPAAVADPDRRTFFTKLGATEPILSDVEEAIVGVHSLRDGKINVSKLQSLAYLRYFYQVRHSRECNQTPGFVHGFSVAIRKVWVYGRPNRAVCPHLSDVYLPSDDKFGPDRLLQKSSDAPGLDVYVLDPFYLQDPPATIDEIPWSRWLCKDLEIRKELRIVDRSGRSLSSIWNYVAEYRPKMLLPMLQHLWKHVASFFTDSEHSEVLREEVMHTSATKLCRTEGLPACKLSDTFLPKSALLKAFARFTVQGQLFPFLDVEDADLPQWDFLCERFSVKDEADLDFLLSILSWIKDDEYAELGQEKHEKLLKLYVAIRAQCLSEGYGSDTRLRIRAYIEEEELVYLPASGDHSARWSTPSHCRLGAPSGMLSRDAVLLEEVPLDVPKGDLTTFYTDILGISKASIDDLLDELYEVRNVDVDFDYVLDIYRRLDKMVKGKSEGYLNQEFERHQMIYIDEQQRHWYKPSECLWASTTRISGKIALSDQSDHYKDLRNFFIKSVGVKLLTLRMVYEELLHSSNGKSADELKSTIRSLNALLLTDNEMVDPEPLLQKPIFVVRHGNGSLELVSGAIDFAIPDREDLASHFRDKVTMLDCSLEEILRLRPFLEWAGLTTRYLSASVKEITSVVDGNARRISRPDRDLNLKAHAFLRIAATFNSPRWQTDRSALYETFRNTKILETDAISSVLMLHQDGQAFEVALNAGDMHIDDKHSSLDIFVPRSRKAQDICFSSALPKNLATWLMQHPRTHAVERVDKDLILVLTSCLGNSRSVVDDLLERHGIIHISVPNDDGNSGEENATEYSSSGGDDGSEMRRRGDSGSALTDTFATLSLEDLYDITPTRSIDNADEPDSSRSTPLNTGRTPSRDSELSSGTITSRAVSSFQSRSSQQPSLHRPSIFGARSPVTDVQRRASAAPGPPSPFAFQFTAGGADIEYRIMVERVVNCARRATFPSTGVFAMKAMADALAGNSQLEQYDGFDNTSVFHSTPQLERNRRVGAAGELYVYELLSRFLQGWNVENWQSRIRHKIKCHADYRDLEPWTGRETADFVYNDTQGDFTELLRDKGYLDHIREEPTTTNATKYLIEVKTTTGACETPFFMSGNQYRLMQRTHSAADNVEKYIIARVFNVNSDSIGIKVYVDPERLRIEGSLAFSEEKHAVVPKDSLVHSLGSITAESSRRMADVRPSSRVGIPATHSIVEGDTTKVQSIFERSQWIVPGLAGANAASTTHYSSNTPANSLVTLRNAQSFKMSHGPVGSRTFPPGVVLDDLLDTGSLEDVQGLLETSFDIVATGGWLWLTELVSLGYSGTEMAKFLLERHKQSPWIYFEPWITTLKIPNPLFHAEACAHEAFGEGHGTDRNTLTDVGRTTEDACVLRRTIASLCGLAGVTPDHARTDEWIGVVDFESPSTAMVRFKYNSEDLSTFPPRLERILERVCTALAILQDEKACCDRFTVICDDPKQSAVELRSVHIQDIVGLWEALRVARVDDVQSIQNSARAARFVLPKCLSTSSLTSESETANVLDCLHSCALTSQFLCLALVFYCQAHLGPFDPFFLEEEVAEFALLGISTNITDRPCLRTKLQHLTCLGSMLNDPIMTFSLATTRRERGRRDVLATADDIIGTWGPAKLTRSLTSNNENAIVSIGLHGGVIHTLNLGTYHWTKYQDLDRDPTFLEWDRSARILVGTPIDINTVCQPSDREAFEVFHPHWQPLGTRPPYWKLQERQIGLQAGQYATGGFNLVWSMMPGVSLKSVLMDHIKLGRERWAFLDASCGLQVSLCSGLAKRVRMRELLSELLPIYVERKSPKPSNWPKLINEDLFATLGAKDKAECDRMFEYMEHKDLEVFWKLALEIVGDLEDTGLHPTGDSFTVAFVPRDGSQSMHRIDFHSTGCNFWTKALPDDDSSATFAYFTLKCLQVAGHGCRKRKVFWPGRVPLLQTEVLHQWSGCSSDRFLGTSTLKDGDTYLLSRADTQRSTALYAKVIRPTTSVDPQLLVQRSMMPRFFYKRYIQRKHPICKVLQEKASDSSHRVFITSSEHPVSLFS